MSATLSKLRTSWVAGPAGLCRVRTGAGGAGPCRPRQCRIFPAGEPVVQPGPVRLVLVVLRLADVKFDLFHWAVIIGFWAAALLYFYWAETRRSFVYIWDYVNYINKQYNAEAAFLQSPGPGSGISSTLLPRTILPSTPCSSSSRSA